MLRLGQKTGSGLYLAINLITTIILFSCGKIKEQTTQEFVCGKDTGQNKKSVTHGQTEITDVHLNSWDYHNMLLYVQSVSRQ